MQSDQEMQNFGNNLSNDPTISSGGFVSSFDYMCNFMIKTNNQQASGSKVELAGLVIEERETGNRLYYVFPWQGNIAIKSVSNPKLIPGFSEDKYKVIVQVHTHPVGGVNSHEDAQWSTSVGVPVFALDLVQNVVRQANQYPYMLVYKHPPEIIKTSTHIITIPHDYGRIVSNSIQDWIKEQEY